MADKSGLNRKTTINRNSYRCALNKVPEEELQGEYWGKKHFEKAVI